MKGYARVPLHVTSDLIESDASDLSNSLDLHILTSVSLTFILPYSSFYLSDKQDKIHLIKAHGMECQQLKLWTRHICRADQQTLRNVQETPFV